MQDGRMINFLKIAREIFESAIDFIDGILFDMVIVGIVIASMLSIIMAVVMALGVVNG